MDNIIYLDNAATSFPKPDSVHDAVRSFYSTYGVNPGRSGSDLALTAEEMIHETRILFSDFFNQSLVASGKTKDPNRMVFTMNATMSLNLIINGTIYDGDHVVTTTTEHNSVIRPINHKVREGAEATFVEPDAEGYINPEDIRKAIKKNTKLVIVNHASNVIGTVQDIKAIGAICKELDVQFAVDASQTVGVLPIDMPECNISFLAFTGHKGLLAPTGTGGICVADDAEISCSLYGGTGVNSIDPYHIEDFPFRLEAGTLNLAGIAGMNAGLKWINNKGMDKIRKHEMDLFEKLQRGVSKIKGVHICGTDNLENRVTTMSVVVDNYDPSDIATILDVDYNVQIRSGLQCAPLMHKHLGTIPRGTVRFSVGPMNTQEEIDIAIKGLAQISAERNGTSKKTSATTNAKPATL